MSTQQREGKRLPRRRAAFAAMSPETIREIARQVVGAAADTAEVVVPGQGVNNQTWIVHLAGGEGLVVKLRPQSRTTQLARNSPHWPRYIQQLLGLVPNGGLTSLLTVTEIITAHGSIRVPQIYRVDLSGEIAATTYLVSEHLRGVPFDWVEHAPGEAALLQLGDHLARMHGETATTHGFGIFATGGEFLAGEWWPRFGKSYRVLADELCRASVTVREVRPQLERALEQATASGAPAQFALICQDQTPTHYLDRGDGTISGMVDIEAHLWGPGDYELATVELWARDRDALRKGYERSRPWPETLGAIRPAYWFYTWMEWLYCTYTMLHDEAAAADLEQQLVVKCREMMGAGSRERQLISR